MRALVLAAFLIGILGTAAELLLVGHTEGFWQWLPLLLIGLSLAPLGAFCVGRTRTQTVLAVRSFQVLMILFILSGIVGVYLHYDARVEFKLESDPSLAGWLLFRDAMKSALPPALAPAAMVQFGLLGLAYTWRHPACSPKATSQTAAT